MNFKLTLLALIEIVSGLSMGVAIMAITYLLLKYYGKKRYDINQNNQAFGIFTEHALYHLEHTFPIQSEHREDRPALDADGEGIRRRFGFRIHAIEHRSRCALRRQPRSGSADVAAGKLR